MPGFFSFNKRFLKDALGELSFFASLFLKNKVQSNKNNYGTMFSMTKQVSLQKISSILQKIKIGPKSNICPFWTKAKLTGVQEIKVEFKFLERENPFLEEDF